MGITDLSYLVSLTIPRLVYLIVNRLSEPFSFFLYSHSNLFYFLVTFLKKHSLLCTSQLVDICVVDYPSSIKRFELVFIFLSTRFGFRIFAHSFIGETVYFPSISHLFKNSVWLEREVWDTFGVYFSSHPDLRRILTDYGFDGFPLRKDFPLSGYIELRYDDEHMHIVYEPVEFSQNFRHFDFLSPWEAISN